jgi:hypothetical protein
VKRSDYLRCNFEKPGESPRRVRLQQPYRVAQYPSISGGRHRTVREMPSLPSYPALSVESHNAGKGDLSYKPTPI